MPKIIYKEKEFECDSDKSLLDSISSQGTFMPYSCRGGFCHACMVKATKGTPPPESQEGLSDHLKKQGCFLPCVCKPTEDMEIEPITADNIVREKKVEISEFNTYSALVVGKDWLNNDVVRICLEKPAGFQYKAGQFINIAHPESGHRRSYSLASIPCENFLELHIRRVPDGELSNWICDSIGIGYEITIEGPTGECYYQTGKPEQDIILAGVSTGLAPLYGIARDALENHHTGNIYLFHASLDASGLYYKEELDKMVVDDTHFKYIPCVLRGDAPENGKQGAIDQLIIDTLGNCEGKAAYLCGDGLIVEAMRRSLIADGLSQDEIYADAFTASA